MKIVSDPHKPLGELESVFARRKARLLREEMNRPIQLPEPAREQLSSAPVHAENKYTHRVATRQPFATYTEEFMRRLFRNVLAANR